jgi:small subunit ribosomal protein S6
VYPEEGGGFVRRDYELGLIVNPEASEEETRGVIERVEQIVANHGGQVVRVNQWGRRRLAYPIERQRDGFYVFIDMILTPETVAELERTLRVSERVLRHMVRRRDPKAVQKEREEREARAAAAAAVPAAPESEPAVEAQEQPAAQEQIQEEPQPAEATAGATTEEETPPVAEAEVAGPAVEEASAEPAASAGEETETIEA